MMREQAKVVVEWQLRVQMGTQMQMQMMTVKMSDL
jgi:hypothetical protein